MFSHYHIIRSPTGYLLLMLVFDRFFIPSNLVKLAAMSTVAQHVRWVGLALARVGPFL
jgi:hypothetical protein